MKLIAQNDEKDGVVDGIEAWDYKVKNFSPDMGLN